MQWAIGGENNVISKLCGLVMTMDAMIGSDFAKGLASLKTASEGATPVTAHPANAAP